MEDNPKIVILSEQLRGQSFELTKDRYTIGRTEECDICVPDPTVSSHHCTLTRVDERRFSVADNGSTNGTRVNGVRIDSSQHSLSNSDILQVGGIEMLFDCEGKRGVSSTTQTVIDLENTETGELPMPEMTNFSPFGPRGVGGRRESRKTIIILGSVIGTLLVAVLIALIVLMFKLVGG